MMRTVNQVSKLTGRSIRALHHYDAIGLLPPTTVTEAGYRLYDDAALKRLETIMLFRELEMPLSQIKALLDAPSFNEKAALMDQRELLKLKAQRLNRLIEHIDKQLRGGETMDFSAFDSKEMEKYAAEARKRWGETEPYREFERKHGEGNTAKSADSIEGLMRIFDSFGELLRQGESESGEKAISAACALKNYISANFYNCTNEILAGLGEMYVQDERFKANIDERSGEGTAQFARSAIRAYLK